MRASEPFRTNATMGKAIFVIMCVRKWNIKFIDIVPKIVCSFKFLHPSKILENI